MAQWFTRKVPILPIPFGQIGDSLFFPTLKKYFQNYAFKNMTVDGFKNYLSKSTNIDLTDFFDFWIYSPGFPHFSINNLKTKQVNGKYQVNFTINQNLLNTDKFLKSSVIEIGALDKSLKLHKYKIEQIGKSSAQKLLFDFEPQLLIIDPDEKISAATTDEYLTIDKPMVYDFQSENFSLDITSMNSPAFFYCAHHWIAPDIDKLPKNIKKTYDKYWQIEFYSNSQLGSTGKFNFYLSPNFNYNTLSNNKEKLKLLFRENNDAAWKIIDSKLEIFGSEGVTELKNIRPGQYTVGLSE
jgi:hypothetical protein